MGFGFEGVQPSIIIQTNTCREGDYLSIAFTASTFITSFNKDVPDSAHFGQTEKGLFGASRTQFMRSMEDFTAPHMCTQTICTSCTSDAIMSDVPAPEGSG